MTNDYKLLRAASAGQAGLAAVDRLDLAALLAEFDALRAAVPAKAKKNAAPAGADPLPAWLPLDTWAAFLDMRKKIKKPATELAQKLLLKKLTAYRAADMDPEQILNQSIMNCWQDLYEPKDQSRYDAGATRPANRVGPRAPLGDINAANNAAVLRLLSRPAFDPDDGMTVEARP